MVVKKCFICSSKESVSSIHKEILGESIHTVIENVCDTSADKIKAANANICQSCAVSLIHATSVLKKLQNAVEQLLKKKPQQVKSNAGGENHVSQPVAERKNPTGKNETLKCVPKVEEFKKIKEEQVLYKDELSDNQSDKEETNVTNNANYKSQCDQSYKKDKTNVSINANHESQCDKSYKKDKTNDSINTNYEFQCDQCEYKTEKAVAFKRHLKSKHQIERARIFKCSLCPESYVHSAWLKKHTDNVHENNVQMNQISPVSTESLASEKSVKQDIADHSNEDQQSPPFKCPLCPETYQHKSSLRRHHHKAHALPKSNNLDVSKIMPNRAESMESEKNLEHKISGHSTLLINEKSYDHNEDTSEKHTPIYKCSLCSKSYQEKALLKQHKKEVHEKHRPQPEHNASKDIKRLATETSLEQYACVVCGKNCKSLFKLRKHMDKYHCGEELKNCPNCGKCFKTQQKYESHVFSEKCKTSIYSCQYLSCNKRFSKLSNLRQHMLKMHIPDENEMS